MRCASVSDAAICPPCIGQLMDDCTAERIYNRLVYGLKVMRSYGKVPMAIQGDSIYAMPDGKPMPPIDQEVLFSLGWFWDDRQESFRVML